MSDKLPMSREQIAEELLKCYSRITFYTSKELDSLYAIIEHILRIGTTELREENKRLRGLLGDIVAEINDCSDPDCWDFYEKAVSESKKNADNFFKSVPF